jgi:arylsulfatase A-like enzyme
MNVLLVIADSLRAQNTSLHDYERETTPFLESFAKEATVYTNAYSAANWSLPSHASIFTGLYPAEHGLHDEAKKLREGNSVFESLRDDGYETGLFSYNGYINGGVDTGLDRGFDTVSGYRNPIFPNAFNPSGMRGEKIQFFKKALRDDQPVRSLLNGAAMKIGWDYPDLAPDWLTRETMAGKTPDDIYLQDFLDWHEDRSGEWAACINFMKTHNAYRPSDEYDRWSSQKAREIQNDLAYGNWEYISEKRPVSELAELIGLYDGCILEVDQMIATIMRALKRRGDYENTLIVVTSDHGEAFGETSFRDGITLAQHVIGGHECLLHVPLLVKSPGQQEGGIVQEPATLTKFPTVANDPAKSFKSHTAYAMDSGLNVVNAKMLKKWVGGRDERFFDTLWIGYTEIDGDVIKTMSWKDKRSSFNLTTEKKTWSELTFEFEKQDLVVEIEDTVDENVKKRLAELGYR